MKKLFFYVISLLSPLFVLAQGRIVIPELPPELPAGSVYLNEVKADIRIKKGTADIQLEQLFKNDSHRTLEGQYLFALPALAQIYDFSLYINGKKTAGELLPAEEATKIYEDIVRRIKDPALLEFAGHGLFRARIFPILPKTERRIELSYAQTLQSEGDLVHFTLPIRQSGQGRVESYHMTIELDPGYPVSEIYSPSHTIQVRRASDSRATITFEATNLEGHKDFILYYSESREEVDLNLLAFRPRTDRDGFFMIMARPGQIRERKAIPKDVVFVIDVSGSMDGEKIEQARNALLYCMNTLGNEDRFEIVSFSSQVHSFQGRMNRVSDEVIDNARYFVSNLQAMGGTNIDAALSRALSVKTDQDARPTSVVFLTDGLPTEGEQDIARLLTNIEKRRNASVRIFNFGVGYDVNTFLLDKLALDSGGSVNYVKPGESIEREVSLLFAKIANPVLADPEIRFGAIRMHDVYPQKLPNLYKGERAILFGRYSKGGRAEIILSGNQENSTRRFSYSIDLPERETENAFIASLWANRKVADLLNRIRFEGENEELLESVKILAEEYGIVTPYTSYLVREEQEELAIRLQNMPGEAAADRVLSRHQAREMQEAEDEETIGGGNFLTALSAAPKSAQQSTGKGAVTASRGIKRMAAMEQHADMLLTVKRLKDKTFRLKDGTWMEADLSRGVEPDLTLGYLSDAYFRFLRDNPEARQILSLGESVIFRWKDKIIRIEK